MQLRRLNIGCFGGGTGLPSLLGGLKTNPWLHAERRRDDVRQRRQLGSAARRARRAAAGRRAEVRAGAGAQRARSAPRAAGAAADARARAAARAHRRQPAALDDGAIQRRFPGRGRRPALAARLRRARVAGERRAGEPLRASTATAARRAAKSKSTPGRSAGHAITRLWLEPRVNLHAAAAQAIAQFDAAIIGPGQLLHQPDADLPGARRARGDPAGAGPIVLVTQPADRRARHVALHRRRGGARR